MMELATCSTLMDHHQSLNLDLARSTLYTRPGRYEVMLAATYEISSTPSALFSINVRLTQLWTTVAQHPHEL